ncbi:hypothetical protein [Candidatus Vidania fulgoroideorum]
MRKLKPLNNNIIIKNYKSKKKSNIFFSKNILISNVGKVLFIPKSKKIKSKIKIGDKVIYSKKNSSKIQISSKKYIYLKFKNIICVLE